MPRGPHSALPPLSDRNRMSVLSSSPRSLSPATSLPTLLIDAVEHRGVDRHDVIEAILLCVAELVPLRARRAESSLSGHFASTMPISICRSCRASRSLSQPCHVLAADTWRSPPPAPSAGSAGRSGRGRGRTASSARDRLVDELQPPVGPEVGAVPLAGRTCGSSFIFFSPLRKSLGRGTVCWRK